MLSALSKIWPMTGRQKWVKMGEIYSNAFFAISAMSAHASEEGPFCTPPARFIPVFDTPVGFDHSSSRIGVRKWLPIFDNVLAASPVTDRGWIYQKRLLAPATLHFGLGQMFWECKSRDLQTCAISCQAMESKCRSWSQHAALCNGERETLEEI